MLGQLEQPRQAQGREGSPWTGMWAVVGKEMADHLTSARMKILEALIVLTAAGTVFTATQNIREAVAQDSSLFLRLFTTAREPLPSLVGFLSFLVPLIAIALAFDAINGEFNQRTLSRVLAQPIYRDALLLGKFLAGLFTLALVLLAIWLLIMGMGILRLGLPPSGGDVARSLLFLMATIFYGGIWLALALTFSIVFRQPATAALASIAIWLLFMIFWNMLANLVAQSMQPIQAGAIQEVVAQAELQRTLARLSPNTLFGETALALLSPEVRTLDIMGSLQLQFDRSALPNTQLPLGQSLVLIWPQLTGLIAASILLFALGYVLFQRQEIRA